MADTKEVTNDPSDDGVHQARSLQMKRVLVPVLVLGAIVALVAVGLSMGWDAQLSKLIAPSLVKATGSVVYNGDPVTTGYVQTAPVDGNFRGALGPLDEEGNFELSTHLDGTLTSGAYPGEHKIAVVAGKSKPGQFAPTPIVPIKVYEIGTTDLRISVTKNATTNHFEIVLNDE